MVVWCGVDGLDGMLVWVEGEAQSLQELGEPAAMAAARCRLEQQARIVERVPWETGHRLI